MYRNTCWLSHWLFLHKTPINSLSVFFFQLPRRLWPWGKSSSSLLVHVNPSLTLPATHQCQLHPSPLFTLTRYNAHTVIILITCDYVWGGEQFYVIALMIAHFLVWCVLYPDLTSPSIVLFFYIPPLLPSLLWFHRFLLMSLAPQAANGGGAFSDYSSSVPSTPSISQREMRIETIAASNTPTPIRKQSKRRSNIFTVSMRQLMQSNAHSQY